ncbi:MAG: alanine dehydrogenase [Acidimicrobiia bacterium]
MTATPLTVGIPTEVKDDERRVALTPDGVRELASHGVDVRVQAGAGLGASITDDTYRTAGARVLDTAEEVWATAGLVCKVKEPQPEELALLRADLTLFTYLHLAAYPKVAEALCAAGTTGVAYETVMRADGSLPLLAPMSEVAGRMAVQAGARFLEAPQGGRGVLLGGAPGVQPGRVTVIGAGNVGWNAAWIAAGMEAEVNLLDRNLDRLRFVDQIHKGRITTLASNRGTVERCLATSDLVIGAVLVPGGRAPVVITEEMVASMQPGSVLVDVAIDQGGCAETSRETSHHDPTFVAHGVVHYCVGNIPGAVPHTSTHALTNATLPYLVELAVHGPTEACRRDPVLAQGLNIEAGEVVNPVVAASLGLPAGTPCFATA